jgi:hypothetical protein
MLHAIFYTSYFLAIEVDKVSAENEVFVQTLCKPTSKSYKKSLKNIDILHCLLYHCIKFQVQIHHMLRDTKREF